MWISAPAFTSVVNNSSSNIWAAQWRDVLPYTSCWLTSKPPFNNSCITSTMLRRAQVFYTIRSLFTRKVEGKESITSPVELTIRISNSRVNKLIIIIFHRFEKCLFVMNGLNTYCLLVNKRYNVLGCIWMLCFFCNLTCTLPILYL